MRNWAIRNHEGSSSPSYNSSNNSNSNNLSPRLGLCFEMVDDEMVDDEMMGEMMVVDEMMRW